jgi:hypothetical protein
MHYPVFYEYIARTNYIISTQNRTIMTNTENETIKAHDLKVVHQVDRIGLEEFGYERSGNVKGDPQIYVSYLNRIFNGDLVDEGNRGFTEEEKQEKREEITRLEKREQQIERENKKYDKDIEDKKKKIEEYRQKLLDLHEKKSSDPDHTRIETFSPVKFSINLFILIMLTGYLFFFYVSAAYKALYVDFEAIADNIAQGIGTGSIMPGPYELTEAISYNFLLFLVPFIFYAFGWAFHVILEMERKSRFVFLGLLIAVTFTVDLLLALIIHTNTELAKELMGLQTVHWSQSSTFYIILFLGFMVYIVWSILLDSLLREWDKGDIPRNIKKIIQHMKKDVYNLESKKTSNVALNAKIHALREDLSTVMHGNLKRYIDQFTTGWISYLSPASMKPVKERCLQEKKEFEEKNAIKPGLVKVISRKG